MKHRTNPALATVAPLAGVTRDVTATVIVHPAGSALRAQRREPAARHAAETTDDGGSGLRSVAIGGDSPASEDGSLVTEYGLLAVVAATLAGAVISWASGGALVTLFNALLRQARALVGA